MRARIPMHSDFKHGQTCNILRCVHVWHIANMSYSVPNDSDLNMTHRSVCFDFSNRWRLDRCSSCSRIELVSVVLCCRKSSVVVCSNAGDVVGCRCFGGMEKNFAGIAVGSRQTVFCVCRMRTANSVTVMSTGHDGMVTRLDWNWSSGLKTFEMVRDLHIGCPS